MKALNIICAFVSVACAALCLIAMCNHYHRELGFDYIGVIVAIIGVIVAVVVGWQIYNLIKLEDIREDSQTRERQHNEFVKKNSLLADFLHTQSFQIRAHILWLDKEYMGCYIYNIFCLREYSRINECGYIIHEQHFVDVLNNCAESLERIIINNNNINKEERVSNVQELHNISKEINEDPIKLHNKKYNGIFQKIKKVADDYYIYISEDNNFSSLKLGEFAQSLKIIRQSLVDVAQRPQDYRLLH